jgi:hypothetical protein
VSDAVTSNNGYGLGAASSAVTVRNTAASANSVGIAPINRPRVRVAQSTLLEPARALGGDQWRPDPELW